VRPVPLVGRDREWQAVQSALHDGSASALALTGEAGVGKSRLVSELTGSASAQTVSVSCFQLAGESLAYSSLYRTMEVLERHGSSASPSFEVGTGTSARLRQFERWAEALVSQDSGSRALFVVEDLHWADESTLAFVGYILHVLRGHGLLTVLTWRNDGTAPPATQRALGDILRLPTTRGVVLDRLGRTAILELAAHLDDADEVGASGRADLADRSEGNPYLLGELLAGAGRLPGHVEELLLLRASGLPPDAVDLAQLVAVAGATVDDQVLASAAAWPAARFTAGLRALLDTSLVLRQSDTYSFRHSLAREALLDRLLPVERRARHASVARALELAGVSAATSGPIALHWHAAGDAERAVSSALRAAHDSFSTNAFAESWAHYTRALQERTYDPPLEVLAAASEAARWAGDLAACRRLTELGAERSAEPNEQASFLERLGRCLWELGLPGESSTALERAAGLLDGQGAPEVRAPVVAALARNRMVASRYEEAGALASEALALARSTGRGHSVEADALITLGCAQVFQSDVSGLELLREGLRLAQVRDERESICRAYSNLVFALDHAGRLAEATDAALAGMRYLTEQHLLLGVSASFVSNAVAVLVDRGRFDEARSILDQVLPDMDDDRGRSGSLWLDLARLSLAQGDLGTAQHSVASAGALREADDWVTAQAAAVQARLAAAEGDRGRGVDLVIAAMETRPPQDAELLYLLCRIGFELCADLNARRPRRELDRRLVLLLKRLPQDVGPSPSPGARAEWATATAEARRAGDTDLPALWEHAAEEWVRADRPWDLAYCTYRKAAALAQRRQAGAASVAASRALTIADRIGAHPLSTAIRELQQAARLASLPDATTPPSPPGPIDPLTRREHQVLELLADGATNRQLASRLYISERTAEVHVSSILRKLEVSNRLQAVALYHQAAASKPDN